MALCPPLYRFILHFLEQQAPMVCDVLQSYAPLCGNFAVFPVNYIRLVLVRPSRTNKWNCCVSTRYPKVWTGQLWSKMQWTSIMWKLLVDLARLLEGFGELDCS